MIRHLLTLALLLSTGCSSAVLSVDDIVLVDGQRAELVAYVQRDLFGWGKAIRRTHVEFFVNGQEVAERRTTHKGRAEACWAPNETCRSFEAKATVRGRPLRAEGSLFEWDSTRTIVAVDIDETICATRYRTMLFQEHDADSQPLTGAVEALNAIAADYHIVYVTARPRFLLGTTRSWLNRHGFPRGPVLAAPGMKEWWHQEQFKKSAFAGLRRQWPNLLIGIGDRDVDVDSGRANRMLALIVNRAPGYEAEDEGVDLPDWTAVGRFFSQHKDLLRDPARLASRIGADGRLGTPPARPIAGG